jgi:tripartite-type tricarboxylate transporter receptor subunit TctC
LKSFLNMPEEFDAFVKEQHKVWKKLITEAGIEKQ